MSRDRFQVSESAAAGPAAHPTAKLGELSPRLHADEFAGVSPAHVREQDAALANR